ncbi:MAG: hypothetical protein J2P17_35470, partial [Mycobacterium sp.]|nr:hypothetical protein [Mycobacterium sp.]
PVSQTSRTAPSLKSRSNFRRVSAIARLPKAMSPRYEGKRSELHMSDPRRDEAANGRIRYDIAGAARMWNICA